MSVSSKSSITDPRAFVKKFGRSLNEPNKTVAWHSTDNKQNFEKNIKNLDCAKMLTNAGWTDSNVEYRFNNYGFRTDDDFDLDNPAPGIITIGCSYTEGIGINVEDTWGYKICQKLGCKFYNLGQSGTGIEAQYRLLKAWAPILKPIAILSQGSWNNRYEFIIGDNIVFVNPWSVEMFDKNHSNFYTKLVTSELNNELMVVRTYDAIKQVISEMKIPFYELHPESIDNVVLDCISGSGGQYNDYARDLSHPGKLYNSAVANYFNSQLSVQI